ncbi:nuclear polyadenylated RNA-binding protein 3 [Paraconiothyrium brasiliense]|uniref:Nuclear polyadenylated RNA-binding protein 3 n=1 Tax=Paraconiothyrium brasiliense TaxID=300254 RepID=A0ABR3RBG2_9PLEO
MDPMLGEPALSIGTPASYQQYPQQTQTPSANSSTSYYADASQNAQIAPAVGAGVPPGYTTQGQAGQQDTPAMHNFSQPSASFSDANHAPVQENRSSYAFDANAFANQQNLQAQSPNVTSVDVQALLDQLSTPANGAGSSQYAPPNVPPQPSQQSTNASSLPAAPHLPPRPPPQEKPSTHPNYNPNDDIRSFHPHSSHRGSIQSQPLNVRGGTGSADKMSPTAGSGSSGYGQRQSQDFNRSGSQGDDEDSRWPPEVNKKYEDFLDQERRFVTDGQWDQFPMGSRLFIGNLPTEKVTKRDIFHRFHRHGELAQISIKQAYGFVQFLTAESCSRALRAEQGQQVRGRKMHLEVSKPQRNTKKAEPDRNAGRRRSRSPDYGRGIRAAKPLSPPDNRRFRDDYRPTRSPSPRRNQGYRARDPTPDRYRRRRSSSRSPRRYRSPSPRRGATPDLPLPFRAPNEVPDVQVLVLDEGVPRDFIRWVEETFERANLRVNVLILSPRLNETAVVRRQIIEGVLAIVRLNSASIPRSTIHVQLFDRSRGNDNVSYNEYADLGPPTAVALVADAKQKIRSFSAQQPAPPTYGQTYGAPAVNPYASHVPTANAAIPPNLTNLISTLDPNSLSQLLGAMSGNGAQQAPQAQAALTPDLARLLSSVSTPAAAPAYNPPTAQPFLAPYQPQQPQPAVQAPGNLPVTNPYVLPQNTQYASQSAQGAKAPDMAEIMAQLAKYQR